jgi:hypothetical protein
MVLTTLVAALLAPCPADALGGGKATFNAEAYLAHIRYLASDDLAGRGPGSEGIELASRYIAEQFREAGLKPAGVDGTYFQPFEIRNRKTLIDADASFEVSGMDTRWRVRDTWIPMPFCPLEDVEGAVAFAGFGVEATEFEYNDFAEFDAKDKVLLVLRYEPKADDPEAKFGGKDASVHSLFNHKVRIASEKGAKALIIVNPPSRDPEKDELYEFSTWGSGQTNKIPIVHVKRELANAMLRKAGLPDIASLEEKLNKERKSLSQDLPGIQVKIRPGLKYIQGKNVIGVLDGDGTTDEMVALGAHYDHLGKTPRQFGGGDGSAEIHNGADDNASGSAGIIELARAFAREPRTRRKLLFIAFAGEELGLLGSKHFVDHPTIELTKVRAMINFDMIGRVNQDKLTIYGTTTAKEFKALVSSAAEEAGLKFTMPRSVRGMFDRSDHASFYKKDIPVLFPFTGTHKQYHKPDDDWELIDSEGAARLLSTCYTVAYELANMTDGPTFVGPDQQPTEADEDEKDAEESPHSPSSAPASQAAPPAANADAQAPRMPKVRLGIVPRYTDDKEGLVIDSVIAGPAQKAGMKDGDIIIRIGADAIDDIYSYMESMGKFNPGDEVEMVVQRGGETVTLKVKLEAPPKPANAD